MKIKLDDAYFGAKMWDSNIHELKTINLFDNLKVRRSVAYWVANKPKLLSGDWLHFCFGDLWGRCEYEFIVDGWVDDGHQSKVDIYEMYVKPNEQILKHIVDSITISSAKAYLVEDNKRREEARKALEELFSDGAKTE